MARILFIYSTVDGHTREICDRLREIAIDAGHETDVFELTAGESPDPAAYDRVVIGASIRYGKHRPEVARYMERHAETLQRQSAAFFSVNAVARKPDKKTPDTNPYVRKFLASLSWRPAVIEIFGGKIDYPSYGLVDKTMIRFIMWMTKGPTDPNSTVDFTDWGRVDSFGRQIATFDEGAG